jgi:hypothetical protein
MYSFIDYFCQHPHSLDPTAEELTCEKPPYLPANDSWDSGGAGAGATALTLEAASRRHLEVQFRLLRHEMVGPLQEGIQTVMQHVLEMGLGDPRSRAQQDQGRRAKKKKEKKKSGIGSGMAFRGDNTISYVFHDVELLACGGDQNSGVYFETTFALPPSLASLKKKDRQDFWDRRKLLLQDTLVHVIGHSPEKGLCIVPVTVAQRKVECLAQNRPTLGLICSLETVAEAQGHESFSQLLDWMYQHQRQGHLAVPLLLVETSSSYVSIAPALRSIQTMARSGAQLPLAKYLLPAIASSTLEEDGAAGGASVLPHYIQVKRYVWNSGVTG